MPLQQPLSPLRSHSIGAVEKEKKNSMVDGKRTGHSIEKRETQVRERDWSDLPIDMLGLILLRLLFKFEDIIRFHCVCKTWQSVPTPTVPSPIECPFVQSQWLMFLGGCNRRCYFSHPLYCGTYVIDIPEILGALVRFSKDGWLLMSRPNYSLFFFNPFTKAKIDLPNISGDYPFEGICFTSSPTSYDCTVLGILGCCTDSVCIYIIHHGEENWTAYKFDSNLPFYPSNSNPVYCNGLFYCLGEDGSLGVFDLNKKDRWTVYANRQQRRDLVHQAFLLECDGKLLSVLVGYMGKSLSVFGLDHYKMAWKKVENLGDKMLFVSHPTSLSATKVVEGMENKIYFPRFYEKYGVFYSLKKGKYQSFGSDYFIGNFFNTKEQMHCSWIEPNTQMHANEKLNWLGKPKLIKFEEEPNMN